MKISPEVKDNYAFLKIEGSITVENRNIIEKYFSQYFKDNKHIIIDLSETSFIDSSSLGVIILYHTIFKRIDRHLIVINLNNEISQMFSLTGIVKRVQVLDTLQEALDFIDEN